MARLLVTFVVAVGGSALLSAYVPGAVAAETAVGSSPSAPDNDFEGVDFEGVLLLRNGGVLQGAVTRTGDRYHVTRAHGEMEVSSDRVVYVGKSLEAVYQWQRSRLPQDAADSHLALAEWCLRHDLLAQAARELINVRGLDSRHPKLALVERRLGAAQQSAAVAPHKQKVAKNVPKNGGESADDEMQRLEKIAADLPAGVIARFSRKVQPLLVNNCTTSGCHKPSGEQQFQLDRALLHGLSNRRTTLRNLAATLELVDRDRPHASQLLTIPRRTHGDMRQPAFGPRQQQRLLELADWVTMVTDTEAVFTTAATTTVNNSQAVGVMNRHRLGTGRPAIQASPESAVRQADYEAAAATLRPRRPLRHGVEITPWRPKDEFDPEIFNRQMHAPRTDANATLGAESTAQ